MSDMIWVQFYVNDYLGDTSELSTYQHGIYLLLLLECYKKGSIPNDLKILRRISKVTNNCSSRASISYLLKNYFSLSQDGTFYTNKRVEEERVKAYNRSEKGKKAAESRWKEPMLGALPEHCLDDSSHIHIHNNNNNNSNSEEEKVKKDEGEKELTPLPPESTTTFLQERKVQKRTRWGTPQVSPTWCQETTTSPPESTSTTSEDIYHLSEKYLKLFYENPYRTHVEKVSKEVKDFIEKGDISLETFDKAIDNKLKVLLNCDTFHGYKKSKSITKFIEDFSRYEPANFDVIDFYDRDKLKQIEDNGEISIVVSPEKEKEILKLLKEKGIRCG